MSNNPTPESLAWNYQQVRKMTKDLNALKIDTTEFQRGMRNLRRASNQLANVAQETADVIRRSVNTFDWSMIDTQIIRDKLPRKAKKAFIKKHGRQAYHQRFPPPKLAVYIHSPGGMIE